MTYGSKILPYNRFSSLGANFPKWWTLSFSRNFSNLEIYHPNIQKPHKNSYERHFTMFVHVHEHLIYSKDEMLVCKLAQYSWSTAYCIMGYVKRIPSLYDMATPFILVSLAVQYRKITRNNTNNHKHNYFIPNVNCLGLWHLEHLLFIYLAKQLCTYICIRRGHGFYKNCLCIAWDEGCSLQGDYSC